MLLKPYNSIKYFFYVFTNLCKSYIAGKNIKIVIKKYLKNVQHAVSLVLWLLLSFISNQTLLYDENL